MRYRYPGRGGRGFFIFPFLLIAFVLAISALLMVLWNRILVDVVPVKPISYLQAIGLFVLSRILFGNFRRSSGGAPFRRNAAWKEKLGNMSDEDRERFRQQWKDRCSK